MKKPSSSAPEGERIFISCSSRVARKRLLEAIGVRREYFKIKTRLRNSRGIYLVTAEEYERIKGLRGITRTKDTGDLAECW